ncbi:unnamed protein product, partial [Sphacelaria rigidula]
STAPFGIVIHVAAQCSIRYYHRHRVGRQKLLSTRLKPRAKLLQQLARAGTHCVVTRLSSAAIAKISNASSSTIVRQCTYFTSSKSGEPQISPDKKWMEIVLKS